MTMTALPRGVGTWVPRGRRWGASPSSARPAAATTLNG
jgi:hypothetical protein